MYPPEYPTVRNLPLPDLSHVPGLEDTSSILLTQTPAPVEAGSSQLPRVRGHQLLAFIGSGGMGVVYKARHLSLQRTVALKMLHEYALSDDESRKRFQAEAEAVARVQHPNIIQVFEVGTVEEVEGDAHPRPFLSLEYMNGGSLTRFTETPQSPAFAARMVEKLARAAHAAHQLGIVHRDLKPANVLLTNEGEPKIADFGVAKLCGQNERLLTQAGMTVGTPEYMSPEQSAGEEARPAADIYSLGVILYQLLTARLPLHGSSPVDTMYLVRNEEPVSPRKFQPNLPRDLETICLKCLAKRPNRRYATAEALADDLARWAEGRTILARPVGSIERTCMWARRNPTVAALWVAIVVVAALGLSGVVWKWLEALNRAQEANYQASKAEYERAGAERARFTADMERRQALIDAYRANMLAVSSAILLDNVSTARRLLDLAPPEHRRWEWQYFWNQLDNSSQTLGGDGEPVNWALISSGAERVLTVANGEEGRVWDTESRRLVSSRPRHTLLRNSILHPRGESQAIITNEPAESRVIIRDMKSGRADTILSESKDPIATAAFSQDGEHLATATTEGYIRICRVTTGRQLAAFQAHPSHCGAISFSPDGKWIATSGRADRTAIIWNAATGERVRSFECRTEDVDIALINATGDRLITSSWASDNKLSLWDIASGKRLAELAGHNNHIKWFGFSPDGSTIATCSYDQKSRLWDAKTGREKLVLRGHTGWVVHGAFSPDSKRLVTASHDHTLRIWDTEKGACLGVMRGHTDAVLNVGFSRDGNTIVSVSADRTVKFWDVRRVETGNALSGHSKYVYSVACHPDNKRIASASWDGTVRIWNASTGNELKRFECGPTIVSSVAFHPNGRWLAAVCRDDAIRLWDIDSGRELHRFRAAIGHWTDTRVVFSPDGKRIATGDNVNHVRVWDVNTKAELAVLKGHGHRVRDLAFSPDGRFLVSAGNEMENNIRVWDAERYQPVAVLSGHSSSAYSLAFHPEGKVLVSGSTDGTMRTWNTKDWTARNSYKLGSSVYGLAFTPDGTRLACACSDQRIRLWDAHSFHELAELLGHGDYVHSVAFTPDGERLISGSGDGTLRVWDGRKSTPATPHNRP